MKEHDCVLVKGVIVAVHKGGEAYSVEIFADPERANEVLTVVPSQMMIMDDNVKPCCLRAARIIAKWWSDYEGVDMIPDEDLKEVLLKGTNPWEEEEK